MGRTTDEWAALLNGLEGVSLAAGHETFPAFDDNPDQSDVSFPCVRVKGMATWSTIGAPSNLVPVLAASIDSVAEVIRLRRAITDLRDDYLEHISYYAPHSVAHTCCRTAADDLDRILNGDTDD